MLEQILKLYVMAMAGDVRSPLPHLFGPPGCGKSTVVEQAAELLGVNCHIINVARISPLDLEGVQMPVGKADAMRLQLLHATFWTQLKDKDILLLDEFLRGFPEVYNGLLDILTSRQVGGFRLPKVFIIAASNSTVAYDKALEDRLLHLPVPDPRTDRKARTDIFKRLVSTLGLLPQMETSAEMQQVFDQEIAPMYEILDAIGTNRSASPATLKGSSLRNLIGQVQLREIRSVALRELIDMNNTLAKTKQQYQHIVLPDASHADPLLTQRFRQLTEGPASKKLTPVQRLNAQLNLQLVEMEEARKEGSEVSDDGAPDPFLD